MGLNVSSGIKVYRARVAQDEAMPFVVCTENGYTQEEERQLIREAEYAEKHGKRYASVREALDDILRKK